MTPLLVIPAEVDLAPVYFGTALVLGLVVFIMAVAWATRATAVAALAVGICLAGGAVLAVSTAWLADIDGPLSPGDAVVLRFIVAMFLGLVVLSVLLGRRCWKAERARPQGHLKVWLGRCGEDGVSLTESDSQARRCV
ncbi:MAG: hypothetical protein M3552_17450 [Planctomycetota bacterium]|nr:hypothetical protein [Planctomycetota bacterium]